MFLYENPIRILLSSRVIKNLITITLFCLLSACAFVPHETQLNPTAVAGASDIGRGKSLYFKFVDERDDTVIGHRGAGGNGAKITSDQLPSLVEFDLKNALSKKNFTLTNSESGSDASVLYRLRSFKFDIAMGFFTGEENSNAALAVSARKHDRTYDKVYRYGSESRTIAVPTGGSIDDQMNAGLTSILQQAYGDSELDAFLSSP